MRGPITAAAFMLMLAGCGSFTGTVPNNPVRDVLGVSADEPGGVGTNVIPAAQHALAFKESQICTRGYIPLRQDVERGENDRAFADWQFSCKPYGLSLLGFDVAGLVPF